MNVDACITGCESTSPMREGEQGCAGRRSGRLGSSTSETVCRRFSAPRPRVLKNDQRRAFSATACPSPGRGARDVTMSVVRTGEIKGLTGLRIVAAMGRAVSLQTVVVGGLAAVERRPGAAFVQRGRSGRRPVLHPRGIRPTWNYLDRMGPRWSVKATLHFLWFEAVVEGGPGIWSPCTSPRSGCSSLCMSAPIRRLREKFATAIALLQQLCLGPAVVRAALSTAPAGTGLPGRSARNGWPIWSSVDS